MIREKPIKNNFRERKMACFREFLYPQESLLKSLVCKNLDIQISKTAGGAGYGGGSEGREQNVIKFVGRT